MDSFQHFIMEQFKFLCLNTAPIYIKPIYSIIKAVAVLSVDNANVVLYDNLHLTVVNKGLLVAPLRWGGVTLESVEGIAAIR